MNALPAEWIAGIGNYEIIRRLATGGMAEIFLAWQRGPGGFRRQVVLKRIHPHLSSEPEFVQMFQREARLAAVLSHPNIVHIYELVEGENGEMFLAMELVRGDSLRGLMRANRRRNTLIPPAVAVRIVREVCDALQSAHDAQDADGELLHLVHRDIAPSNILVSESGQTKLCDFGVAKALEAVAVTRAGQLKGKFPYMSPEHVSGQPIDHRSDLFSLGCVLYELTVGVPVFRRDSEVATLKAILYEPIASPSSVRRGYPWELERIVMRCLERNPEDRYQNASDLESDLAELGWNISTSRFAEYIKTLVADGPSSRRSLTGSESAPRSVQSAPRSVGSDSQSAPSFPRSISSGAGSGVVLKRTRTTSHASWGSPQVGSPAEPPPTLGSISDLAAPQPVAMQGEAPAAIGEFPFVNAIAPQGLSRGDRALIGAFMLVIALSAVFWLVLFPRL